MVRLYEILEYENPYLKLDPFTFDQSDKGWRSISNPQQQLSTLSTYIKTYVQRTSFKSNTPKGKDTLSPGILYWHLGQLYAMKNNIKNAVHYMKQSINPSDDQWNDYVYATIAFLLNDKKSFIKYSQKENYNKNTLKRLKAKWNKPYKDAY
jgi:hypothetical protein